MSKNPTINTGGGDYRENISVSSGSTYAEYVETQNIIQTQQDFEEISLESLESEFQGAAKIETRLLDILKRERLLVLGGDLEMNKDELALHLSFLLAKDIGESLAVQVEENITVQIRENITIQQWRRAAKRSLVDINLELQKRESPTIFLLMELTPQDVGFTWFTQVYQDNSLRQHYIIVSTDISCEGWRLGEATNFFPALRTKDIYNAEVLLSELNNQLNNYQTVKLEQKLKTCLEKEPDRQPKNFIDLVSRFLKTPKNIRRFVELFHKSVEQAHQPSEEQEPDRPKQIDINQLIETVKGDEEFIRKLYYDILSPDEQLLAIGISFFNGLFEDQLFAALEVWQKYKTFDYDDLEKLQDSYFKYFPNNLYRTPSVNFKVVEKKTYQVDIRSVNVISRKNRLTMFKIAWEKQRRRIIDVLDVMVEIVRKSVIQKSFYSQNEWELYGEPIRVRQLHDVISETISDIGLISTSAETSVRGALLVLAAQKRMELQDVAARAIARWYQEGSEEKLFRTLQDLYSRTRQREVQIEIYQENRKKLFKKRKKADRISKKVDSQSSESESSEPDNHNNYSRFGKNLWKIFISPFFNDENEGIKDDETEKSEYKSQKDYYIGNTKLKLLSLVKGFELTIFSDFWYEQFRIMFNIAFSRNLLTWKEQFKEETTEEFTEDCIGATIALIVSYAAIHDYNSSTSLSNKFDDWLKELSQSRLPLVHLYFGYNALFNIVPLRLIELQDWLRKISQKPEYCLHHAVALSLAHTYTKNSEGVDNLLSSWYKESITKTSKSHKSQEKVTQRDALLKTVALSYGLIEYNSESELTVDKGFEYLAKIVRQEEEKPFVREASVSAICNLTFRYFEQIEAQLQKLVTNFSSNDINKLLDILTEIYLEERANQKGNKEEIESETIERKGRSYQIWKSPEKRPLTSMEETMNNWVKLENTAAQQIAIRALVSFANALDILE